MPDVTIHYRRPPDRLQRFTQALVHRDATVVVTLLEQTPLPAPMRVDGRVVLEDGSPAVWFTFPGVWHDIGRFHDAAGRFTGIYANVLEPVHFRDPLTWDTTDLFLDVWLDGETGAASLLDEDELAAAVADQVVDTRTAARARAEADRLIALAGAGHWPPALVHEWTLERARAAIGAAAGKHDGGSAV